MNNLPSNMFLADAFEIRELYGRWTYYAGTTFPDAEELVVLTTDSVILCEKHRIPCPGSEATASLWCQFMLNLIPASKMGDLKRARGLLGVMKSQDV